MDGQLVTELTLLLLQNELNYHVTYINIKMHYAFANKDMNIHEW